MNSNKFKKQFLILYVFLLCMVLFVFKSNVGLSKLNLMVFFDKQQEAHSYKNDSHKKVIDYIKKTKLNNENIFSFPGDPMFYVYLNQKPPYFTSIYESSSYYGQESLKKYIADKNIKYVILNLNNRAIQDGVPNYVRSSYLFNYILNNFGINKKIDNFLILEKGLSIDYFESNKNNEIYNYIDYLKNINLGFIPRSEGLYKMEYVKNGKFIISNMNSRQVEEFLEQNNIISKNIVVLLENKTFLNKNKSSSLKVYTQNNLASEISFNNCQRYCIINLSRVPIFYKIREIKKIIVNDNNYLIHVIELNENDIKKLW